MSRYDDPLDVNTAARLPPFGGNEAVPATANQPAANPGGLVESPGVLPRD